MEAEKAEETQRADLAVSLAVGPGPPSTARNAVSGPELFDLLRSLALPAGEYAVFGSGPLIVRGLVPAANDLDVISRGAAWDAVCSLSESNLLPDGNPVVSLFDGLITVGTTWLYGEFDIDELIDTAESIDGLPFVRLEHVIAYKRAAGRRKDLEHLRLLAAYDP